MAKPVNRLMRRHPIAIGFETLLTTYLLNSSYICGLN